MDHSLKEFLVLNILNKHPYITRYRLVGLIRKLEFSICTSTVYYLIEELSKRDLIKKEMGTVYYKPINNLKGKSSNGSWVRRSKEVYLYSLTNKGFKELFRLEVKIRIILNLKIYGEVLK